MKITKESLKGGIIGASVMLLFTSGMAYAAEYPFTKNVKAVFNNIKVIVDGHEINPKDPDGKKIEPFIMNGTTYLPLRAISTSLGKEVNWDQKSYTVTIGKKVPTGSVIGLHKLTPWNSSLSWEGNLQSFKVAQEIQQPSINSTGFDAPTTITYLLKGNYKNITGKFAVTDDFDVNTEHTNTTITIVGDGNTLYTSPVLNKGSDPIKFDIDVIGIDKMEIKYNGSVIRTSEYGETMWKPPSIAYHYAPNKLWDVVLNRIDQGK